MNERRAWDSIGAWWRWLASFCAGLLALSAQAQDYAVGWSAIAGGGGTSASDGYVLSGSIGQAGVGQLSGGSFGVIGGLWSAFAAVETSGPPRLTVARAGADAVLLSWPSSATGYILQQNQDLASANWSDTGLTPIDDGTTKSILVQLGAGARFYRLKK